MSETCAKCGNAREPSEASKMRGFGFFNCSFLQHSQYVSGQTACRYTPTRFTPATTTQEAT